MSLHRCQWICQARLRCPGNVLAMGYRFRVRKVKNENLVPSSITILPNAIGGNVLGGIESSN